MLFQVEIPRAFLSISIADRTASRMAKALRLPLTGARTWMVISGRVRGGWHDLQIDYVAKDLRFLGYSYLFATPPPSGQMSLSDLRAKADLVRTLILPGVNDWTSHEDGLNEKSMFGPANYFRLVKRIPKPSVEARMVLMQLDQATGTPHMVLVRYGDTPQQNADVDALRRILKLTLDKGEFLPP